ncbi:hypothetical protein [Sphingobacterium sp. 1.A.4]|uniref:hypothetical protein n=1 Tax=Sphingobacterium sp. 1.A.4 TaxID=2044603 RepID=UPI000C0BD960|nr:hypothetical protein [Sphingobacterium sp. 1.A.4]
MEEFIREHVIPNAYGAIAAIVGAVWLWWRSKPKERIENDGGIVENAKKVLEMSEGITERLEKQLEASDGIIEQLKEKLRIALEEENACKKALKAIREELEQFRSLFDAQKIELEGLKEECRLLRLTIEANEKTDIINDGLHLN